MTIQEQTIPCERCYKPLLKVSRKGRPRKYCDTCGDVVKRDQDYARKRTTEPCSFCGMRRELTWVSDHERIIGGYCCGVCLYAAALVVSGKTRELAIVEAQQLRLERPNLFRKNLPGVSHHGELGGGPEPRFPDGRTLLRKAPESGPCQVHIFGECLPGCPGLETPQRLIPRVSDAPDALGKGTFGVRGSDPGYGGHLGPREGRTATHVIHHYERFAKASGVTVHPWFTDVAGSRWWKEAA